MSGFEIFGVVAALPGIIDLCIKYGEKIEKKVKLFMTATEHSRLQAFVLELCTGGINDILLFFRSVHSQLDKAFQLVLHDSITVLNNALIKVYEAFPEDSFADKAKVGAKLKFAFFDAKRIEEAVTAMELWQDRFSKRAEIHLRYIFYPKYGIHAVPSKQASDFDSATLLTPAAQAMDLQDDDRQQLFNRLKRIDASRRRVTGPLLIKEPSATTYKQLKDSHLWVGADKDSSLGLVEYRSYKAADAPYVKTLQNTVRNVATKLREADDSSMHILPCRGFSDDVFEKRFVLHFSYPAKKSNPRSLRNLLADPGNVRGKKHSLSDRLQLAQSIATAVLYVHSCGFVHKNLRPENIIIFDEDLGTTSSTYPYAIGQPYLVGYDGVRQEDAPTLMLEVTSWQERIYLPAERLKDKEHRMKFSWRHDVYSLGVVLLEIALWENFTSQSGPFHKALNGAEDPGSVLRQIWLKQLPRVMGNKYAEAVTACFDMLRSSDGGEEIEDEDGIGMGTTFISRVLDRLEDIRL